MTRTIKGKVVAITGAARGIGLATARALLDAGAHVGICDIDEVALKEAADTLPGEVATATVDVTDPEALRGFVDRVEEELGPIDIMINNAGIMPVGDLLDEPDTVAVKTLELNTLAVVIGTKRALETMVPRGRGHVITLASMAGVQAFPGLATYNASKFGALGFSLAVREEFRGRGIDVSVILPSFVDTDLTSGTKGVKGMPKVSPEDVAAAIVAAIRKPRAEVYVPREQQALLAFGKMLPDVAQRGMAKLFGLDRVFLDEVDEEGRRDYDERIGKR